MVSQEHLFQAFVAPAIFVSAGGLLILTLNARLLGIVNRIRGFNQHLQDALEANHNAEASMLEAQIKTVTTRATIVRNALLFLTGGVVGIMATCLILGLALVVRAFHIVGVVVFVLSISSMMVGLSLFMKELTTGLFAVFEEGKVRKSISSNALSEIQVQTQTDNNNVLESFGIQV